jgi:hypothetical protein
VSDKPHRVEIEWRDNVDEWLPLCSCGWVGSYVADRQRAEHEAIGHAPVVFLAGETDV